MSIEWGLFNDEGLVAGGFVSQRDAEIERDNPDHHDPKDGLTVATVCSECHRGRSDWCEECHGSTASPRPSSAFARPVDGVYVVPENQGEGLADLSVRPRVIAHVPIDGSPRLPPAQDGGCDG